MPDILVRDVPTGILNKLKKQAVQNGRSLQRQMHLILEDASGSNPLSELEKARKIRKSIRNKHQTDSVILLREDRNR